MNDPVGLSLLFLAEPGASENSLSIILLKIFAVIVLVFINGFFVAAEFAIVKVRLSQLELKLQEGKWRASSKFRAPKRS